MRNLTILLAWSLHLAGCAESNGPELGDSTILVEVDALSGRTNPVWGIRAEEAKPLSERVRRLELSSDSLFEPAEIPGYRGFWLQSVQGDNGSNGGRIWVGQGVVIHIGRDGVRRTYTDRGVEELLISMARERGHGQLFEQ
jgi:hypothetical protein